MQTLSATLAIAARDNIGEAPAWDAIGKRLIWVDHAGELIHEAKEGGASGWYESRRWDPGGTVSAALPRLRGGLVVAGGNEIFLLDDTGHCAPFAILDIDPASCRLNDVKCDPRGRLWAGTLACDFSPRAALYCIHLDGTVTTVLRDVSLANGFDWSPDGCTFYFIDSMKRAVEAFDCDMQRGSLTNPRTVVSMDPVHGIPNGMTVDKEGCLWVALTCGGEVHRFAPDGAPLARVELPVPGVTSCAFGGAEGRDLFITTRSGRVPDFAKALGVREEMMESSGPHAGALFVCKPGPAGSPATPFPG
jgi:sugar lactone lactonase YvrE